MTVETIGVRALPYAMLSATVRNSSSIGSISGEWKAWDTASRLVFRPRAVKCAAMDRASVSSPEMTTARGPLSAAMPVAGVSSGSTSSSAASTATIAPPCGRARISRPRAATRRAASGSVRTPATWAAASSPTEWPARKSGRIPQDSMSR